VGRVGHAARAVTSEEVGRRRKRKEKSRDWDLGETGIFWLGQRQTHLDFGLLRLPEEFRRHSPFVPSGCVSLPTACATFSRSLVEGVGLVLRGLVGSVLRRRHVIKKLLLYR